jgi:hypothetical protein
MTWEQTWSEFGAASHAHVLQVETNVVIDKKPTAGKTEKHFNSGNLSSFPQFKARAYYFYSIKIKDLN